VLGTEHVIFFVRARDNARQGIWIAPLDEPGSRKRLANSDANAVVLDHAIVYATGAALVAQRIALDTLTLRGKPELIDTSVGRSEQHELFATAGGDVVIHGSPPSRQRELRWVDMTGRTVATVGEPMEAWDVAIAPSGRDIAVARADPQLGTLDVWTYQESRPVPRRISTAVTVDVAPVWSRDSRHLAWASGANTLMVRDARAASGEIVVNKFPHSLRPTDWTADGSAIVITQNDPQGRGDIAVVGARPGSNVRPYVQSPFDETSGVLSPDGRWLAYVSDESGRPELYADAFPAARRRARLTVGGAMQPRWSRDGRRVYFRRGREIHAVDVGVTAEGLEALASYRLFDAGAEIRAFDLDRSTARILVNVPAADTAERPLNVVVNVSSLLPADPQK
jgi:hypothetical protein